MSSQMLLKFANATNPPQSKILVSLKMLPPHISFLLWKRMMVLWTHLIELLCVCLSSKNKWEMLARIWVWSNARDVTQNWEFIFAPLLLIAGREHQGIVCVPKDEKRSWNFRAQKYVLTVSPSILCSWEGIFTLGLLSKPRKSFVFGQFWRGMFSSRLEILLSC